MYNSSWEWTFGYSKHFEYIKIKWNFNVKFVHFVGSYLISLNDLKYFKRY